MKRKYLKLIETLQQNNYPEIVLNDYQQECVDTFYNNYLQNNHKRYLFGLKMGLGKTYTALKYFEKLQLNHFVIITKATLIPQWIKSYYKVFKKTNITVYDKPHDEKELAKAIIDKLPQVSFVSYDKYKKVLNYFWENKLMLKNDLEMNIILDESQVLKHQNSQISRSFIKFSRYFNHLAFLSGSLIANESAQLYTQFRILRNIPKYSYREFVNEYFEKKYVYITGGSCIEVAGQPKANKWPLLLKQLHEVAFFKDNDAVLKTGINYFGIETKLDWDKSIETKELDYALNHGVYLQELSKDKYFITFLNTPTLKFNRFYQFLKGYLYGFEINEQQKQAFFEFQNEWEDYSFYDEEKEKQTLPQKLQDLTAKPSQLFVDNTRLQMLDEIIGDTLNNYVIFYNENYEKEIITKVLDKNKYQYALINGNNSSEKALDTLINTFNKDKPHAIIIQSKAGSQGIDGLQEYYHNIIWYSLPYSYELFSQANARLHRIKQTNDVNVYYFKMSEWEQDIWKRLADGKSYQESIWYNKPLEEIITYLK